MLANGVAEAEEIKDGFAAPEDGVAFWAEGTQDRGETDLCYPGPDGVGRAARVYPGAGQGTFLYIHGGGWAGGSIALNHRACRLIAAQSGWDVLSVSYRLAPDHPYPAGLQDCRAALDWLRTGEAGQGLNARRIALGGGPPPAGTWPWHWRCRPPWTLPDCCWSTR